MKRIVGALSVAACLGVSSAAQPAYVTVGATRTPRLLQGSSSATGDTGAARQGGGGSSSNFNGTSYGSVALATPTTTLPEAEEHIAAAPSNASALVAAISDFSLRGGSNTTKYSWSLDGGATWHESYVPLVNDAPATGDGVVWPYNSDPVVAIDGSGRVFLADLYFHDETGNQSNGYYVSVAAITSSGVSFTQAATYAISKNLDPATSIFEDKPWIAVDASSGTVWASWTRFVGNSDMIVVSESTDHGQTWSAPVQVSDPSQNGGVQGSQIAVGPDGSVYVVYEVSYVGGIGQQFFAKATGPAFTFSSAKSISPTYAQLSFRSSYRTNDFAALAVSPADGSVHVAYADQPSKGSAIEYIRSTDGGAHWSSPVLLNDTSGGQRLMPAIAVDELGAVHASWFDTRNGGRSTSLYDIYATRSQSAGAAGSFAPNKRVTPNTIDAGTASFIGDYSGNAARGGYAHPVWTSGGFNNGQLQTATLH